MPKNTLDKRIKGYDALMSGKNLGVQERKGFSSLDPRAFHRPGSQKK